MYIVDDDTGEILTIHIETEQIPPNDLKELIKILSQNKNN